MNLSERLQVAKDYLDATFATQKSLEHLKDALTLTEDQALLISAYINVGWQDKRFSDEEMKFMETAMGDNLESFNAAPTELKFLCLQFLESMQDDNALFEKVEAEANKIERQSIEADIDERLTLDFIRTDTGIELITDFRTDDAPLEDSPKRRKKK